MKFREDEELRMFEQSLTEKELAVTRMRDECAKLSVELETLVENQIVSSIFYINKKNHDLQNLRSEIAHYRKLMEQAENLRTSYQSDFVIDTPSPLMRTSSHHYGSSYSLNVRDTR